MRFLSRSRAVVAALAVVLITPACGVATVEKEESQASELTARLPDGRLPPLGTTLEETTVSGISSGAFMAVQMHVAHARWIRGAAVFAGGPFLCSGGFVPTALGTCMRPSSEASAPDADLSVARMRWLAATGLVDPEDALARGRVLLYGGADDTVLAPAVMDSLASFYGRLLPHGALRAELRVPHTGHTFPTLASGGPCEGSEGTFIGHCGVDGAGLALGHLLGPLAAPAEQLSGRYVRFDQWRFGVFGDGLARDGYVYLPASCAQGAACRVHVVFHGCLQNAEGSLGETFVRETGYARWADTNRVVVLFPQTSASLLNPNACWDWWGYTGPMFASKVGLQISAVRRMVEALAAKE